MEICPRCLTVYARPRPSGRALRCPHCGESRPGGFPPYAPDQLPPLEMLLEFIPEHPLLVAFDRSPAAWRLVADAPVTIGREHAGDDAWAGGAPDGDAAFDAPGAVFAPAPEAPPRIALPDPGRQMSRAHAVVTWIRPDANDPREWRALVRDLGGRNGTRVLTRPVNGRGEDESFVEPGASRSLLALKAPRLRLGGGVGVGVELRLRVRVAAEARFAMPPPLVSSAVASGEAATIPWSREAMPEAGLRVLSTQDALSTPPAADSLQGSDESGQGGAETETKTESGGGGGADESAKPSTETKPSSAGDPELAKELERWRRDEMGACWLRPLNLASASASASAPEAASSSDSPSSSSPGLWLNGRRLWGTTPAYVGDRLRYGSRLFEIRADGLRPTARRRGRGLSLRLDEFRFKGQKRGGAAGLRGVDIDIAPDSFVGLLGPSGCGKTTLLRILAARLSGAGADGGSRWLRWTPEDGAPAPRLDADAVALSRYRAGVAMVPQEDTLHPELTPREELRHAAALRGLDGARERIEYLGRLLRLDDGARPTRFDRPIRRLSGGERKRVNIALGLLSSPELVLLDEPTAALDPATERRVMAHLRRLADQGHTVVCVTHVLQNASLFDRWVVMRVDVDARGGRWGTVDFCGSPAEVLRHYRAAEVGEIYARLTAEDSARH